MKVEGRTKIYHANLLKYFKREDEVIDAQIYIANISVINAGLEDVDLLDLKQLDGSQV